MADFDDSTDPELGAACNRLSAFTLPIPDGALVDEASGLTESDLALILRALYRTRQHVSVEVMSLEEAGRRHGPEAKAARAMTDAFLLAAYQRTTGEPGDPEADALLAEIARRGLDV